MQCLRQKRVKQWRHQGGYKQRARCVPFGKLFFIMPSISLTSLCSFAELQENSISHLSSVWSFVRSLQSLHTVEATLSCVCWHRISQQSYDSYLYSRTELELAYSKVSTKVCGFTFGPISLHLISKRIKEILTQKHQYNAKYLCRFIDSNAFSSLNFIRLLRVVITLPYWGSNNDSKKSDEIQAMLSENKTNSIYFSRFQLYA